MGLIKGSVGFIEIQIEENENHNLQDEIQQALFKKQGGFDVTIGFMSDILIDQLQKRIWKLKSENLKLSANLANLRGNFTMCVKME